MTVVLTKRKILDRDIDLNGLPTEVVWITSGTSGKEPACSGDIREVGLIPSSERSLASPVFMPGESHEQRSLMSYVSYGLIGSQRVGHDWSIDMNRENTM